METPPGEIGFSVGDQARVLGDTVEQLRKENARLREGNAKAHEGELAWVKRCSGLAKREKLLREALTKLRHMFTYLHDYSEKAEGIIDAALAKESE